MCFFVSDHDRCQIRQYDREDFDLISELGAENRLHHDAGLVAYPDDQCASFGREREISWRCFRRRLRPVLSHAGVERKL